MLSWIRNLLDRRATASRHSHAKKRARHAFVNRLRVECLEERAMMTMLVPVGYAMGTSPTAVEIGDFNGDGKADIAELNASTSTVSVLKGNGDGTFQAGVNSAAGGTGARMAAADFNHDGKLDLVTMEGYQIDLLKGNGDGSFQPPIAYYAGAYPNDIDVGDVNNDGFADVFTASFSYGGTTQLFINDGLGGFLPSHNLAIGPTGLQVEGADVNGDGNLDLVQSNGSGTVAVLLGNGTGTFFTAALQNIGMSSQDLKVGDFNGDGKADLVVTNGSQVTVFSGTAAGTFQSPTSYPVVGASRLETGDINGDGNRDVVANNGMVLLGRGTGGFYAPTAYGTAAGTAIALGDLNGDGGIDAVSGVAGGGGVNVTLNGNNDIQLLAGATQLAVSTSGSASAGVPFAVTVTALDANGDVVTGFQGTVGIMGAAGTTPVSYTFATSDNGVHTVAGAATLTAVGLGTYTVTSPFLPDASGTIDVVAGPAAKFTIAGQATSVAGDTAGVTVSAYDAYGNYASNYLGTVHFTSSDAQAGLPSDYTFTAGDAGTQTFGVALKTAGAQTVSANDAFNASAKGMSGSIVVTPSVATSLSVTGGGGFVGSVNAVTITARDAYGNAASGYNGIVHLAPSAADSTTSADAALLNGGGTFTVLPRTMGSQTLTASDVSNGSIAGSEVINVTPGWGARFVATALPSSTVAGQTQSTTLTVYDAFGNLSTVYTGWVVVTSPGDAQATSYVYFTTADAGVKTIPVTLYKAGVEAVTISDLYNPGVTFTQTGITVSPLEAASISVTPLHGTTAGVTQNVTVAARDIYGNVATGYIGAVTFASSDVQAALPANYSFTPNDAGSHTFAVTYKSAGGQDITVSDTATHPAPAYYQATTWTYYQRDIMIAADVLSTFSFKGASVSNTTAGAVFSLTVSASDAYGNTISGYTGTARFSSSDAQSVLLASYTFTAADAGAHTLSVALKTAGSQSITVTDSVNGAITGTQAAIAVKAAAANTFSISTPTAAKSGIAQDVTVTVTDAFGNAVTNYTGTVKLSSSDAQAVLPANYTFSNKDSGTHAFSITLKTVGTQSLTVADTVNAAITATQSGISVSSSVAAVASFSVTGFPATTAGTAKTFTVTARDAQGVVITGYTGTVTFSSNDVKAGLPASYTFTAVDAGAHAFTATLKTAGAQSITVKDATVATAIGSQTGIVITAGVASQFVISAQASVTQGAGFKFTMTVYDAYGNVATGYTGKVHVSSTDAKSGSSDYSFSSKDAGVHTFGTLGSQTLTVTDTTNSAITSKATVNVVAK